MPTWVGTRLLVLRVGTTDFSDAVKTAQINTDDDSDGFGSYAEARAGGPKKWVLAMTLKQDTASTSLWYYMWGVNRGASVAVEFWPHGRPVSGTPSTSQPKFSGTVVVSLPKGKFLGGDANPSPTSAQETEAEWVFEAEPTLATA